MTAVGRSLRNATIVSKSLLKTSNKLVFVGNIPIKAAASIKSGYLARQIGFKSK